MKRGLATVFMFMILMSFAFVSACDAGEPIMKLSGDTNAHASLWNTSTYTTEICYDDIFGNTFEIPAETTLQDTHRCTKLNQMLFLNSENNSHVSSVWDYDVYNKAVCYGNLQCFFDKSDGNDCEQGLLAARMYRKENSHMETASSVNYGVKVCCSDVYMTNTNYEIINRANVGDTVYFVSPPGYSQIKVERNGFAFFNPDLKEIQSHYDEELMANIVPWTISNDVIKGNETDLIVTIKGPDGELLSTSKFDITVSASKADEPIEVGISGLECGDNFTVGDDIPIVVTAKDADDILSGTLYINGDAKEDSEFTNGGTTFMYHATTAGEVKIEVNATNEKELSASYIANIMVINTSVDGKYSAACIASPVNYDDYEETLVQFDASTSKGIIVKDGIAYGINPIEHPFIFKWKFEGTPFRGGKSTDTYSTNEKTQDYMNQDYYLFQMKYPGSGAKKAELSVELPEDVDWDEILGLK